MVKRSRTTMKLPPPCGAGAGAGLAAGALDPFDA
jgi:hypothetical protein